MRGILIALLGAALVSPAVASSKDETNWYNVEVILFTPGGDDYLDAEVWPEAPELPAIDGARELAPAPERPPRTRKDLRPFEALTPAEHQLTDAYRRLESSSRFEPLLHIGWRQPGLGREAAVPVLIRIPLDGAESAADGSPDPAATLPPAPARLEGTLTLILSRYLHLETDLVYRIPQTTTDSFSPFMEMPGGLTTGATESTLLGDDFGEEPAYRTLVIQDSRRMRSKELHYLDHPAVGVLALVTPVELPEPEPVAPPPAVEPAVGRGGMIQR